jgi:hypothetical protein
MCIILNNILTKYGLYHIGQTIFFLDGIGKLFHNTQQSIVMAQAVGASIVYDEWSIFQKKNELLSYFCPPIFFSVVHMFTMSVLCWFGDFYCLCRLLFYYYINVNGSMPMWYTCSFPQRFCIVFFDDCRVIYCFLMMSISGTRVSNI